MTAIASTGALPLVVAADEPEEGRLREGWKWMVTIPEVNREETSTLWQGNVVVKKIKYRHVVPESRVLSWIEKGWLNVRRTTWDDELEWQVVLAQASDPQRPEIKIDERSSSIELSYRGYFIRENGMGKLRIVREPKTVDSPEWPTRTFEPWEFERSRVTGGALETFELDYWTWLKAGPTPGRRDLWLRLTRVGGKNANGTIGVSSHSYPGRLNEVFDDQHRAHVEPDLVVATRRTVGAAERGLTGTALQDRLKAETAPELATAEWLNAENPPVLSDLKGEHVLLGFWGVWNEPSVRKLRRMEALHKRFGSQGLKVIGIHAAHRSDNAKEVLRKQEITFPVMIDNPPDVAAGIVPGETASRYGVEALPAFFLIDGAGAVTTGYGMAPPPAELLEELLSAPDAK